MYDSNDSPTFHIFLNWAGNFRLYQQHKSTKQPAASCVYLSLHHDDHVLRYRAHDAGVSNVSNVDLLLGEEIGWEISLCEDCAQINIYRSAGCPQDIEKINIYRQQ